MKKNKPTCFISYCWENADWPSINQFVRELEKYIPNNYEILIDVSSVNVGDSISDHEKRIDTCDVAILLFTPEYKERIKNRKPSGTYREYQKFLARFEAHEKEKRDGESCAPFHFIPIIFSGIRNSSVPDELSNYVNFDFSNFRAIQSNSGDYFIAERILRAHENNFRAIGVKIRNSTYPSRIRI